jgi:DNA mismatch repair protein MutH
VLAIGEFDRSPLVVDLQIMPIGSPPRDLVHFLKIFLVVAPLTTNIAVAWWRAGRRNLIGNRPK